MSLTSTLSAQHPASGIRFVFALLIDIIATNSGNMSDIVQRTKGLMDVDESLVGSDCRSVIWLDSPDELLR